MDTSTIKDTMGSVAAKTQSKVKETTDTLKNAGKDAPRVAGKMAGATLRYGVKSVFDLGKGFFQGLKG